MNEESFLRALADAPGDRASRLIYADWLDERGDERADFLRVEAALAEPTWNPATRRDLCRRERELLGRLDGAWLQRVRRFTTAPPCRDLARLLPDLVPYARTTTRLHPRRAVAPLPAWGSKIGGLFLWPTREPWPACSSCGFELAPVIQLRRRDFPDVELPPDADLFQLFACPDAEAHGHVPATTAVWRDSRSIDRPRERGPDLADFGRYWSFVPRECSVHPERVVEYLVFDDLRAVAGDAEADRIERLIDYLDLGPTADLGDRVEGGAPPEPAELIFTELGQCPSSKVGGKPAMLVDGSRFDHLLTLATREFDADSFRRWLAVEDQRTLAEPGEPLTRERLLRDHREVAMLISSEWRPPPESSLHRLREPLGVEFGRSQKAHVFVRRDVRPWEIRVRIGD